MYKKECINMKIETTFINEVKILLPQVFGDERGYFMETWREKFFRENVCDVDLVQDNQSCSVQGVLRGLHYQLNNPQGKLVRVVSGCVFDVAVDIRRNSTTFGKYVGVELSSKNKKQLWIPEGFAHGFYVMSKTAEFVYKCSNYYDPSSEQVILWKDSSIGINWPIINGVKTIISERDSKGLLLKDSIHF